MKKGPPKPRRRPRTARSAPLKEEKKSPLFIGSIAPLTGFFRRAAFFFEEKTGQSLTFWAAVALLNFIAQIVFRRELASGAFGTLNTALGVVGLMTVPALAFHQAFIHYLALDHAPDRRKRIALLRAAAPTVVQTFAWISAAISFVLLPLVLPMLSLSRFSTCLLIVLNVLVATGGVAGAAICQNKNQLRLWAWLLAGSALARVVLGAGMAWWQPWTESALTACLIAGLITLLPVLRLREIEPTWMKTWRAVVDRDFLLHLGATFSVLLALYLFSSADRIVAQSWFGSATNNNLGFVNWPDLDGYQTAGLLGRALLWGTQPLLLILFAQRSRLLHTTRASLKFFWIYLGALFFGALLLGLLGQPLCRLFCGADFQTAAGLVPTFAVVMVPLGLLQAFGIFALASRRRPECFVLGACSVAYAILLYNVGRQPQLMLSYMFGGSLFAIMLVLFVGIVRWSRSRP